MERKVEYKYAFGQKIQVDYEWLVAKKKIEKKDEILFNEIKKEKVVKEFEVIYDLNGRARKQKCTECATDKSPMAAASSTNVVEVIEEAD